MKISELITAESQRLSKYFSTEIYNGYWSEVYGAEAIEETILEIFASFFGCHYAWSGKMPCTGVYRCLYCGKIADATSTDYSKVDRDRVCLGKSTKGSKWQG